MMMDGDVMKRIIGLCILGSTISGILSGWWAPFRATFVCLMVIAGLKELAEKVSSK